MQADAVHAFHSRHRIVIAAPDGFRAIGMLLDLEVRGQKRGRPMMLRPIEFNATGYPWPRQADKRGLDYRLVIDEVIAIGLILQNVDSPANFRQYHGADKLVLDPNGLPLPVYRFFRDAIGKGQRVHLTAAPLINALFEKHRVFVRRRREVGRNDEVLDTDLDHLSGL